MDVKRCLITASALALATAGPAMAAPPDTVDMQILAVSPVAPGPRNRIIVLS